MVTKSSTARTEIDPDADLVDLGRRRPQGSRFTLPFGSLEKHAAVFGESGSGKTVLAKLICEGLCERGIPVIAIDSRGDLGSLAVNAGPKLRAERGIDDARARAYKRRREVVIWTPASSLGVPLCLDPLGFEFSADDQVQRVREVSWSAMALTELLGYSLSSTDGRFVLPFLDLVLGFCADRKLKPRDFGELAKLVGAMPRALAAKATPLIEKPQRDLVRKKLHALSVGTRHLLYTHGLPLDIDTLLGRDEDSDRSRISVIRLSTLELEAERVYFVAELARRLQHWLRRNPSDRLQGLLYIDSIDPFLPAKGRRASKEVLKRLFSEARRAGLACVVGSRHPETIDTKTLAKFDTWALGRLGGDEALSALAIKGRPLPDRLQNSLRKLAPGRFQVLSPTDPESAPRGLEAGALLTRHGQLSEAAIEKLATDELKEKFEARVRVLARSRPSEALPEQRRGATESPGESVQNLGLDDSSAEAAAEVAEPSVSVDPQTAKEDQRKEELQSVLALLRDLACLATQDEVAEALGLTKRVAAMRLKELVEGKAARKARRGVKHVYFAAEYHYHEKVGLIESLEMMPYRVAVEKAVGAAEEQVDKTLFFFKREEVVAEAAKLVYFPLYRCRYQGFRTKGMLFFRRLTTVTDNVYMHPTSPDLCLLTKKQGFRFMSVSFDTNPLDLKDLDDVGRLEHSATHDIQLADWALDRLTAPGQVHRHFQDQFHLELTDLSLVFLPLWEFRVAAKSKEKSRLVYVDAVVGQPFEPFEREMFED